ncbi:hypothetical protein EYF80_005852 [Liparis tanakae]|uniref:Uncharacterized protein n=1 Tax=Liparis tanakae TaxID=230148 RepID=A0A4Z2J204_9TELE|nr:hypothetical protein EYF80_005852 [Liparis tanakae]
MFCPDDREEKKRRMTVSVMNKLCTANLPPAFNGMYALRVMKDGDSGHGKTPSGHFNMNGHVSLVLLEQPRCEIEDGMQSGPDTQGSAHRGNFSNVY